MVLGWGIRGRGSRLVVVEVEDVLLEVADPVLLHRERTLELHLTEPGGERQRAHIIQPQEVDRNGTWIILKMLL